MKRILLGAATVAAALLLAAPATSTPPGLVGSFSYAEAVLLGIETLPDPATYGLPACEPDRMWAGYPTPEAAEQAGNLHADDPAVCAADPLDVQYTVGRPPPYPYRLRPPGESGYRYMGAETTEDEAVARRYQGGRAAIEVGNPNVDKYPTRSISEFVVARPLAIEVGPRGYWIEAGWEETSWLPEGQFVFSFSRPSEVWHDHLQYPDLLEGAWYVCRMVHNGFSESWAQILWNGQWHLLEASPTVCLKWPQIEPNCVIEEATEVFSNDPTPFPDMNAAGRGPRRQLGADVSTRRSRVGFLEQQPLQLGSNKRTPI